MTLDFRSQIDQQLLSLFCNNNLLDNMSAYHIQSGGKRFRGQLALLHARHKGVSFSDAMKWALACEVLHNATLVHDDIQDEDPLRRGTKSIWRKFGIPQAINLGDSLIFTAFTELSKVQARGAVANLVACLAEKSQMTVRGQALEIHVSKVEVTNFWQTYLKVAILKTGGLLQAPIEGIEILNGSSTARANDSTMHWQKLGVVYQINDDINDFLGKKQQEQSLKDFSEQKINSLVAWLSLKSENHGLIHNYLSSENGSREHLASIKQICQQIQRDKVIDELSLVRNRFYSEFVESAEDCHLELLSGFLQQPHSTEEFNGQTLDNF